jgi:hypothetical protein
MWLPDLSCDILAKFIEAVPFLRWDIRFVTITQMDKSRHKVLWSVFLSGAQRLQSSICSNVNFRYVRSVSEFFIRAILYRYIAENTIGRKLEHAVSIARFSIFGFFIIFLNYY